MNKLVKPQTIWPYGKLFYASIACAAVLIVILTYYSVRANPVDNFSFSTLLLIELTILLPITFIWVIAARGAKRFKVYAYMIRKAPEGHGMNQLANGLLFLVGYFVVLNLVGKAVVLFKNSAFLDTATVISNHLPLIFALLASWQLIAGTCKLVDFTCNRYWDKSKLIKLLAALMLIMIPFTINFYLHATDLTISGDIPRFTLSTNTLIFTYVLPHSLVWIGGVISAVNLFRYTENVSGKIYRSLFKDVYKGLILVYICILFSQLLRLSPAVAMNFTFRLFLVYSVLILAIAGFQYIYRGSRRLLVVEETV